MAENTPYIIGVTGGIGSGKSVVSQLLSLMGIPVYDCDREAKQLMLRSKDIRDSLIEMVGGNVYNADGSLNRAYLASYMFGHADRVAQVNRIVHPVVRADFKRWASQTRRAVVAVESAILIEAGMENDVDSVWLVYAPKPVRLQRAIQRDASNEVSVRNRMQNQLSDEEYLLHADEVIYNDAHHSLIRQVGELLARQESL